VVVLLILVLLMVDHIHKVELEQSVQDECLRQGFV
jgi:hypothetical protein